MGLNWNFQRGGGIQTKKPSVGGVWIFSGTTQLTTGFGFTSDWLGIQSGASFFNESESIVKQNQTQHCFQH